MTDPSYSERVPKTIQSTLDTVPGQSQSLLETTAGHTNQTQCSHEIGTTAPHEHLENGQKSHNGLRESNARLSLCSVSGSSRNAAHSSLPAFIKALQGSLDSTDLDYLRAKNALSLPSREFRDVCVARYLEFAHPMLPLLDKRQLLLTLNEEEVNRDQISLTLFNAVMLSGVAFVEDEWIFREGFASRQAARKTFFNRGKVGKFRSIRLVID